MRLYHYFNWSVDADDAASELFFGTLRDARDHIRAHLRVSPHEGPEIEIAEVVVATDKRAVLNMLAGQGATTRKVVRTWRVGPRGGLVEETDGSA